MKKLFTTLLMACSFLVLFSQTTKKITKRTCATMQHHDYLMKNRPGYAESFVKYNQMLDEYIKNSTTNSSTQRVNAIVTIPVVVHIVYNPAFPAQNISDAQVISQIQVLNEDYARQNADVSKVTQPGFAAAIGTSNLRFCLAQRDPSGNPTNGIRRVTTNNVNGFGLNDAVKYTNQGGDNAWNVSKYLNIWVCYIGGGYLGYGEFPTGSLSNTWGLVLDYAYTGRGGSAQSPYDLGRTATHEVGHCFNLNHIWGDDGNACWGTDNCNDTPNQGAEHYGCYPDGSIQTDNCTTSSPGTMWMNYMDYTDDACMYMFTNNQCTRMNAIINNPPWNVLQTSNGCTPPSYDASITNIINPLNGLNHIYSQLAVTPVVVLKNLSANALTSVKILSKIDALPTRTLSWTGSLAPNALSTITLSSFNNLAYGAHTFSVWVSGPNGTVDSNPVNDSKSSRFFTADGRDTYTVTVASSSRRVSNDVNPIEENSLLEIVALYPNPAKDDLTINLNYLPSNASIQVYDMFGKLVMKENVLDVVTNLSVSHLAKGVYSLIIVSDNKSRASKRIIIE